MAVSSAAPPVVDRSAASAARSSPGRWPLSTTSARSCRSTPARSPGPTALLLRYKKEVVRLLAEVSLGTGALAVIGGTSASSPS